MKLKQYHTGYLVKRMRAAGILKAKNDWSGLTLLKIIMRKGHLKLRQKLPGKYYVVTEREANDIIWNFSPGGDGWWEPGKKPPVPGIYGALPSREQDWGAETAEALSSNERERSYLGQPSYSTPEDYFDKNEI